MIFPRYLNHQLVVPTKTTCTLANAAVAPNTSILLALDARDIHIEKIKEKTQTRARRFRRSSTKKRTMMDMLGIIEDRAEPKTSTANLSFLSE